MAKKKWKQQLELAKELFAKNRKDLHGLATCLVSVYDDPAFSADVGITDQFALADWLNEELKDEFQDVVYDFLQLRAILKEFPKAADWEDRPIQYLYLETEHSTTTEATPSRVNPGYKERATAAEEKVKDLEARNKYLEERVEDQDRRLKEQDGAIAGLRQELNTEREDKIRLEGRIIELERLIKPQLTS